MTALVTVTGRSDRRATTIRVSLSVAIDPAVIAASAATDNPVSAGRIEQRARHSFPRGISFSDDGVTYSIEWFHVSHTVVSPTSAQNHQTILTVCPSDHVLLRQGWGPAPVRYTGCYHDSVGGVQMDVCYCCFCNSFDPMTKVEHELAHALGIRHTASNTSPVWFQENTPTEGKQLTATNLRDIFWQVHHAGSPDHLRIGATAIRTLFGLEGAPYRGRAVTPA